ncbi:MAG TPA: CheR family methyltransferase [Geobacteraceae bacterium]
MYPQYSPSLDPGEIGKRLARLLVPGRITDRDLERRIARLDERFRVYAACSPHGLWAPGLALTREMRGSAELYLPLAEIRRAFQRLFSLSLRFDPFLPASVVHSSTSWPDALHVLSPLVREANPATLLRLLSADSEFRARFLFSLFLPRRYGGTFSRYPAQLAFLEKWLATHRPSRAMRCLDAACGSGEGTYELTLLLLAQGFGPRKIAVHGTTVEPLELFAAAHGWFPHDAVRQEAFRRRIRPIFADGAAERIIFSHEDLTADGRGAEERYDIILCNGLLGGPLLSGRTELEVTVRGLCGRLKGGGILLAADRFHAGWKRPAPDGLIRTLLAENGLQVLACDEGVAGRRPRT